MIHGSYQISGYSADSLESDIAFFLFAVALRALIINDSRVSAARVSVNRMVDGAVSDSGFLHASYYLFERIKVLKWVSVKFNVGNMSAVGKFVIRSFQSDLFESIYRVVYRNMETVCVIVSVRNARDDSVFFFVDSNKTSRKSFRRRCDE